MKIDIDELEEICKTPAPLRTKPINDMKVLELIESYRHLNVVIDTAIMFLRGNELFVKAEQIEGLRKVPRSTAIPSEAEADRS